MRVAGSDAPDGPAPAVIRNGPAMNVAAALPGWGVSAPVVYGLAAGLIVIGGCMLIWGRIVHRAFLALAGAGVGLLIGAPIAAWLSLPPRIVQGVAAFVLAALSAVLARLVWALLLTLLLAGIATGVIVNMHWPELVEKEGPPPQVQEGQDPETFREATSDYYKGLCKSFWKDRHLLLVTVVSPVALTALILAVVLARFTQIGLTSLLGASWIVQGALLIGLTAFRFEATVTDSLARYRYVLLAITGVLTAAGMVLQYRGALAAEKTEEDEEEASPVKKRQSNRAAKEEKDA